MTSRFGKNRDHFKEAIGIIRVCANPSTLTCAERSVDTITTHVAFTNLLVNQHNFFQIVKEQPSYSMSTIENTPKRMSPYVCFRNHQKMVEVNGIEPMTPCLQSRCSPS